MINIKFTSASVKNFGRKIVRLRFVTRLTVIVFILCTVVYTWDLRSRIPVHHHKHRTQSYSEKEGHSTNTRTEDPGDGVPVSPRVLQNQQPVEPQTPAHTSDGSEFPGNKLKSRKRRLHQEEIVVDGFIASPNMSITGVEFPPFVAESPASGRGENGREVDINEFSLTSKEKLIYDQGFKLNSFNQMASDLVSVTRRLPDPGPRECRSERSKAAIPASVIICFHDEAWTTLLRSVHSIINRSPEHLLEEIILVNDASDLEHLGEPLVRYMSRFEKVKIVRTRKREGLIRARLLGYQHAQASILVFLDSHIECFPGWLEPLVQRISENPRAVPFPVIESIKSGTLSVKAHFPLSVGTFSWQNLMFRWMHSEDLYEAPPKSRSAPIKSPTMPGGLFAISRSFFTFLGTYDPGLDYWGGENMELSFKAWMCNGSVEVLPCSHVGHIFRHHNPIKWFKPGTTRRNAARVASVWMDHYKMYFFETLGNQSTLDFGDVSERIELRQRLNCHNFDWYLKHVHPDKYVPYDCQTVGEVRNRGSGKCVDSKGRDSTIPQMSRCYGDGSTQFWCLRKTGELWNYHQNMYISFNKVGLSTKTASVWVYTQEGYLQDQHSLLCLQEDGKAIKMTKCNGDIKQQWTLTPRYSNGPLAMEFGKLKNAVRGPFGDRTNKLVG